MPDTDTNLADQVAILDAFPDGRASFDYLFQTTGLPYGRACTALNTLTVDGLIDVERPSDGTAPLYARA